MDRDTLLRPHTQGLWIRFYTLDGATVAQQSEFGWFRQYNFTSQNAAEDRWRAAISLGVDYLATDQYERLASVIKDQVVATHVQLHANRAP